MTDPRPFLEALREFCEDRRRPLLLVLGICLVIGAWAVGEWLVSVWA